MNKKIFAIIISAVMALSFAACGNDDDDDESSVRKKKKRVTEPTGITEEIAETEAIAETEPETEPHTEPPTEPINEEELFMDFINGKSKAWIDSEMVCDASYACSSSEKNVLGEYVKHATFENEKELSLEQLRQYVIDSPDLRVNAGTMSARYNISDSCFGYKFLTVEFINLNIYAEDDNSSVFFVFTIQDDDTVSLVYFADLWARRYISMLSGGMISEGGSNGAGAHSGSSAVLDDTGHYKLIEKSDELAYNFIEMYIDAPNTNDFTGIILTTIKTDDGDYYIMKIDDSASYNDVNSLTDYLKNEGMTEVDDEDTVKNRVLESLGVDTNYEFKAIDNWTDL